MVSASRMWAQVQLVLVAGSGRDGRLRQSKRWGRLLSALAFLAIGAWPAVSSAQVQRGFINSGFELPVLTSSSSAACYRSVPSTAVPGWETTHKEMLAGGGGNCLTPASQAGRWIELWQDNFNSVKARAGAQSSMLQSVRACIRVFA